MNVALRLGHGSGRVTPSTPDLAEIFRIRPPGAAIRTSPGDRSLHSEPPAPRR